MQTSLLALDVAKSCTPQTPNMVQQGTYDSLYKTKFLDWLIWQPWRELLLFRRISHIHFPEYSLTLRSGKVFLVLHPPGTIGSRHWRVHPIWKLLNVGIPFLSGMDLNVHELFWRWNSFGFSKFAVSLAIYFSQSRGRLPIYLLSVTSTGN